MNIMDGMHKYLSISDEGDDDDSDEESDSDDDIYNSNLDEDTKIRYFILNNVYKKLCVDISNVYSHNKIFKYDRNYFFLSKIPDFFENNEKEFYKYPSQEYILFITDKIKDYVNNRHNYVHKPSIIILLKLCGGLREVQPELYWLYNSVINKINYMNPNDLFMNITLTKKYDNTYNETELDYVLGSTLIQVGEGLRFCSEHFYDFICKMFQLSKSKYPILLDEFNYIDNNYDLSDDKYNNLKFNILTVSLYQFSITSPEPLELTYFFDIDKPPTSQSIKFPIFLAWLISQKRKNIYYDINLINIVNENTNINKFYKLLSFVDDKLFNDIYFYTKNSHIDILYENRYDIDEIFDNEKNFISNIDDYKINDLSNIKYNLTHQLIGGGYKIPINPFGKIRRHLHYIE
jgi:hypothetical protein